MARPFEGQRAGERVHPGLGRGRVRHHRPPSPVQGHGDVDDATTAGLAQVGEGRLRGVEGPVQVRLHHRPEAVGGEGLRRGVEVPGGVVDQDGQAAEGRRRLVRGRPDPLGIPHVGLDREDARAGARARRPGSRSHARSLRSRVRLLPQAGRRLLEAIQIAAGDRHVGPAAEQTAGDPVADAASTAGYEGRATGQQTRREGHGVHGIPRVAHRIQRPLSRSTSGKRPSGSISTRTTGAPGGTASVSRRAPSNQRSTGTSSSSTSSSTRVTRT